MYVTKKLRFHNNKRYYPGDKFPYQGPPDKAPKGVVLASEYTEKPKADPRLEETNPVATGLAVKMDSISDIPIAGKGTGNVKPVSDAAKQMAEAFSINLDDLNGTGVGGQITKTDVQKYIKANSNGEI